MNNIMPVNPNANKKAKELLSYLYTLKAKPEVVLGVFDIAVGERYPYGENYDKVTETYGVKAGLYSTRYFFDEASKCYNYTQSNISAARHYEDEAIVLMHPDTEYLNEIYEVAKQQGIETKDNLVLHFDETNPNRNTVVYDKYREYLTQLGDALKDLEDRGVEAYLFRIFLELNAPWLYGVYGNNKEGYRAFKNVWRQMADYFFNDRKLNGCLLTYSPTCYVSAKEHFPGEENVDIVSVTMYSEDKENMGAIYLNQFDEYEWFLSIKKPLGFSELSVRTGVRSSASFRFPHFLSATRNKYSVYLCNSGNCICSPLLKAFTYKSRNSNLIR